MLLVRFRDTKNQSERDMILYGLSIFANDQMSVHLLVREGLINTLMQRMVIELDAMPEYHAAVSMKKEADTTQTPKLKRKGGKLDSNKLKRSNLGSLSPSTAMESPTHSNGYGSMSTQSPSYSSYSSPKSQDFDSDADSATYSPVYSDPEVEKGGGNSSSGRKERLVGEDDNGLLLDVYDEMPDTVLDDEEMEGDAAEEEVFLLPIDGEDDDTSTSQERTDNSEETAESPETKAFNKSVIKKMLVLLRDMRLRIRRVPDLAKGDNLLILLRASKTIPEPVNFCQPILSFIVQDTESFVNLMQTNFIINLYQLRHPAVDHENCRLCADMRSISGQVLENVSAIAESGYGRGELAHYLLTGDLVKQKHVAIITALVVRDPKFLYSLLFEHNALRIVLDEVMDKSEGSRSEEACLGVTALAMNLNLYLDQGEDKIETVKEEKKDADGNGLVLTDLTMSTESDSKITFLLSDGERIEFNEQVLVSYSDVFNSMFSRDFQESKFKEVLIDGVSAGGLKYFLQLVQHFQRNPEPTNYNHVPKSKDITVALEAYELAIKYMLPVIEVNVLRHVKTLVDDSSVQDMFEWSMKNKNADILEMSIYYFLNSDLPGPRKLRMLRRANESDYSQEWNHWMVDTIKSKCSAAIGLLTLTE